MKTVLQFKKFILLAFLFAATVCSNAQTVPELVFSNPDRETGIDGADGTVYRFKDVAPNVDALVTIAGRSSANVKITSMDLSNTGYANAFQPQISYMNGYAPANSNVSMDFDFNFVVKGTLTPTTVTGFNLTALDIDGDGASLSEFVQFSNVQSYILESNSLLFVQNLFETLFGILTPTRKFQGPTTNFTNIDVNATAVMTTLTYANQSAFRVRAGGSTGNGSTTVADRMYSFWFKGFAYKTPVQISLPVKLSSFTAMLNNSKVDLKWTSESEINLSHFVVERSTDGINFSDAGTVFAFGNTSTKSNYALADNISNIASSLVYYRLRSVDLDGKYELSQIRVIRISKQADNAITLLTYPNPASNEVRITIPAKWQNKKIVYEIFSANGQAARKIETSSSSQTETISLSNLKTGLYVVKVTCEGVTVQQKIIKQ